jgi:hypothetical protein
MSVPPRDLVLDLLRAIRGDLADLCANIVEVKQRLGILEAQSANLCRRMDRLCGDRDQVKRRPGPVEARRAGRCVTWCPPTPIAGTADHAAR